MGYEFVSPSLALPPVDCPLVVLVPFGTRIDYPDKVFVLALVDLQLVVKRTSHLQDKDGVMTYWLEDGSQVRGRFPWTYP